MQNAKLQQKDSSTNILKLKCILTLNIAKPLPTRTLLLVHHISISLACIFLATQKTLIVLKEVTTKECDGVKSSKQVCS